MAFFRQLLRRFRAATAKQTARAESSSDAAPRCGTIDPKEILCSTPTLNDGLPPASNVVADHQRCHWMHEDDWCQFEFVDRGFRSELARELEAIDAIWKQHSVPVGDGMTAFRELHVRELIPRPLDLPMSIVELETLLGARVIPLALQGMTTALNGVHAIRLENIVFYGSIKDDRLTALGIEPLGRFALADDVARRLEEFVVAQNLALVHWPSRTLFDSPQSAMSYLRGRCNK